MTVHDLTDLAGLAGRPKAGAFDLAGLSGPQRPAPLVEVADAAGVAAYRRLRHAVFVDEQGLFSGSDMDAEDERAVVLVARVGTTVVGGVRLTPATDADIGWWRGSRLAVARPARSTAVGAALVRAACAHAESAGALRFEAAVQQPAFFVRLGWTHVGTTVVAGREHALVRWPIGRVQRLVEATKAPLGALLAEFMPEPAPGAVGGPRTGSGALGGAGFVGDDAAPVPGSDLLAACDAIVPAMVERDPEWAGWCSVLVNLNDLTAMGAAPVGLLDALGSPTRQHAARVLRGFADAARAWDVPVLGGHTTLGTHASMAVTALGRTGRPIPAGGGRPGQPLAVTADLTGGWRPGYAGRQWDSTSGRSTAALQALGQSVASARPVAAKDVSMAGLAGTLAMLAEASGCGAVLDVAAVPRPRGVSVGDWFTAFPGFAMITAGAAPATPYATTGRCGELVGGVGVALRWPDGVTTQVVAGAATGMGAA